MQVSSPKASPGTSATYEQSNTQQARTKSRIFLLELAKQARPDELGQFWVGLGPKILDLMNFLAGLS